jgi:hypothetical protein
MARERFRLRLLDVVPLVTVAAAVLAAQAADGAGDRFGELIRRADTALWGKSSAAVMGMEIKTRTYQRSYEMVVWYDRSDPGRERALVKILGPALWRGYGTLKVGSLLKLFNPSTNHVTVVSHSMLGDSWMGSHFTNDDLVKETHLEEHFQHRLLKKWGGRSQQGEAVTFYQFELTPRPTAPVAWGKIIYELWEGKGAVVPTLAVYYRKARAREPDRSLTFSEVKDLGGRRVPSRMVMTVASKPGEHTAITYKTIRFDLAIPAGKFTEQALRQ